MPPRLALVLALASACTSSADGTYAMTVQQVRSFGCAPRPPGWNNGPPTFTFTLELRGHEVSDPGSFSCTATSANDGDNDLTCMIPNGATDATGAPCSDALLTVRTSGELPEPPGQLADGEIAIWLNSFPDFYATGSR